MSVIVENQTEQTEQTEQIGAQANSLSSNPRLAALEEHAIFVMREVAAECENPALLFSGGKDSVVMVHLAAKAFAPGRIPFPALQICTGHEFPEAIAFRDEYLDKKGMRLLVGSVEESIAKGRVADPGLNGSRNRLQSVTLLDAIAEFKIDAAFGGARRDEDKARAKERVLSFRDAFGQWDPRNQRPELWNIYNARIRSGEHLRAFPLSDWTELDIWRYIESENIELPSLYYAHERDVFSRNGMLYAVGPWTPPAANETVERRQVRYRTVGDMTCTGAVASSASNPAEVLTELYGSRITERGATRADDKFSEAAMEDRKKEGYF
jgi:sulfate adenylyltransferase subunit 2